MPAAWPHGPVTCRVRPSRPVRPSVVTTRAPVVSSILLMPDRCPRSRRPASLWASTAGVTGPILPTTRCVPGAATRLTSVSTAQDRLLQRAWTDNFVRSGSPTAPAAVSPLHMSTSRLHEILDREAQPSEAPAAGGRQQKPGPAQNAKAAGSFAGVASIPYPAILGTKELRHRRLPGADPLPPCEGRYTGRRRPAPLPWVSMAEAPGGDVTTLIRDSTFRLGDNILPRAVDVPHALASTEQPAPQRCSAGSGRQHMIATRCP